MTVKKLRVLLVEASPDDAGRTLAKLEEGGYAVEHLRVDNAPAMQAALAGNGWPEGGWEIVLCSHDPSGFCGLAALQLMQSEGVDLPFLFLSHDLREEAIIHAIQSGAGGYIFKDSLSRLAPAIEHSLREARTRREHREAQLALRELSSHIQDVREQERLHIAHDIHDDMGGTLTAIKLDIAWLSERLDAQNPELLGKAKGIEALVDRCIASANNILRTLRPSVLDSFGIIAAIEMEAEEFEKRTGISCPINQVDEGMEISPDTSIALFRIFQEMLTNIMKHAKASQVTVDIANRKDGVDLIVSDNGRGLNEADRLKPRSFGLRGIQERVAHFNGDMKISSTPGQGTTVAVHIPHTPIHPAADGSLPQSQRTLF